MATNENIPNPADELKKSKFQIRESVPLGMFLGFIFGLLIFLTLGNHVKWMDWTDVGFLVVVWVIGSALLIVFSVDRASIGKLTKSLASILWNSDFSGKTKLAMIMSIIMSLMGFIIGSNEEATGLTQMLRDNLEKLEEKKAETVITKPGPSPLPTTPLPTTPPK